MSGEVLRYAAFPAGNAGGNPAGVVLDARGMTDEEMLAVAAEVGFSETAFLFPSESSADRIDGVSKAQVRYFSPLAEVPFCGHATIATAVAHAERHGAGRLDLVTRGGLVPVHTRDDGGSLMATLTSVEPSVQPMSSDALAAALEALGWSPDVLDDALPPYIGFAGNHHPVLALSSRQVLAGLDYDYAALAALMAEHELDDDAARPPRTPGPLPRPQSVPAWRSSRGPGHRGGCGGARRLPAGTGPRALLAAREHPSGRGHGPSQPAASRYPRAGRHRRHRLGHSALTEGSRARLRPRGGMTRLSITRIAAVPAPQGAPHRWSPAWPGESQVGIRTKAHAPWVRMRWPGTQPPLLGHPQVIG
jgi:hypothetical protein